MKIITPFMFLLGCFMMCFWWVIFPLGMFLIWSVDNEFDIKHEWKEFWKSTCSALRGKWRQIEANGG